jgi:hypothetical protein
MDYYLLNYNPGTPQYTYPRRGGAKLTGTVIVHTAECAADNIGEDTSAEGCANMIANRADYGSYHRLVDSDSIIHMLPWDYEAWQDSETNNWAVGISAALRTSDWLTMPADRRERVYRNLADCAADFVRYMRTKGIEVPRKRISGADARARKPGFCAHGDSGVARSDPGAAFDWNKFFDYTNQALEAITTQGTIQEDELSAADTANIEKIVNRIETAIQMLNNIAGGVNDVPKKVLEYPITRVSDGATTTLANETAWNSINAEAANDHKETEAPQ